MPGADHCCHCPPSFLIVQAEYRRLQVMYEELKKQKIKELEGLVEEQEAYVARMGKVRKRNGCLAEGFLPGRLAQSKGIG